MYKNDQAPLFTLGQIVMTPGALDLMCRAGIFPLRLVLRHQRGDWGSLDEQDRAANDRAVHGRTRILSSYEVGARREKIWIITEADRSVTTVLLPSEY
ncbi:MAG: hypothetical protein V4793_25935 [Paraburkholderia tropica]|uniref:hypothetical protein n=1 Tax=Paraburkholderia tropica TaxID=92647 RepID=UPI001F3423E2|nr:hypothetical protein [Paraburkholderia tropica]MDE1142907.1 hypothetical protein [Paraburkholderia tropica]